MGVHDLTAEMKAMIEGGLAIALPESNLDTALPQRLKVKNSSSISNHLMRDLIEAARRGREMSYAPYSNFNVGAAIFANNKLQMGEIFSGCNIENAAYAPTICGERTAAFKAVSAGHRVFLACAIVGGFDASKPSELQEKVGKEFIGPCGPCRQVLNEFADPASLILIFASDAGHIFMTTLATLLPLGFGPKSLEMDPQSYSRNTRVIP
jgi:cytidine deaminase